MHIHSSLSPCSRLTMEEILTESGSKGLDGVCITDHNSMEVRRYLEEGLQKDGLCVIMLLRCPSAQAMLALPRWSWPESVLMVSSKANIVTGVDAR